MSQTPLLEVKNLITTFATDDGTVNAVDGVSFQVYPEETVGIVGESGCGKSVTAESILRLFDETTTRYDGEIRFAGQDLLQLSEEKMRTVRGNDISIIFQDPMSSLNPVYTIGDQIIEAITLHQKVSSRQARDRAVELLRLTGISDPQKRFRAYPHELSGGMRQRVMIALALSCEPRLLIADEPTTALDVTIQAQILELMNELKARLRMGIMLITHDLSVVAQMCSRVIVMYLGEVIEETDVVTLFDHPLHPYTMGLLQSVPNMEGQRKEKLYEIKGSVPAMQDVAHCCRFAPRCPFATDVCRSEPPILEEAADGHRVRCWHYKEIAESRGEGDVFSYIGYEA
ncbi:ABC transporter ATP-binding protein [Paenibacillus sp. FSL H8-0457]|uniref:ABC transporter ATP-binding protein n=1 Tax=unclassified Paenibacillus TaxID=185978 RepID=UPI00017895D8|nr:MULTISPECIES: ABC transporter ATP-binding protein [unclassified Paenibacillus]ACX63593.1 oligopeptide/dipeptide ABC transporter, ATPase subunit [Paenibacillus sp. Y412MC10]ETT64647.1 oligopeptide/dipeptide ABC transporter ATPase subunit [Paenibacillus sp. FSL H8-457]